MNLRTVLLVACTAVSSLVTAQDLIAVDDPGGSIYVNSEVPMWFTNNDTMPPGTTAEIVRSPSKGTLSNSPSLGWYFKANEDAEGSDSFTYRLVNGTRRSNVATVSLTLRQNCWISESPYIRGPIDQALCVEVMLYGAKKRSETKIQIWSDISSIHLSTYFHVPAGQIFAQFEHPVPRLLRAQSGTLFLRLGTVTSMSPLRVEPSWLRIGTYPSNAWAGANLTGYLRGTFDRDGAIQLRSNSPHVHVPPSVNVVAGTVPTFPIVIDEARWSFPFIIEARVGPQAWTQKFQTTPVILKTEWVDPVRTGGTNALLKVSLNGKAGVRGLTVSLRSNSDWATPPATASIKDKNTTVWVTIPTKKTKISRTITIWARYRGVEQKTSLTLVP